MAFHIALIRASHGVLGTRLGHLSFLLLHSVGRKSGRPHVTPISYFSSDGIYFLVGSNWGKKQNASWYYNLLNHPHTLIEVKGHRLPVMAYPAEGAEYDALWNIASRRFKLYLNYKAGTPRHIPIMILKPDK